jgi:hypothetical protein
MDYYIISISILQVEVLYQPAGPPINVSGLFSVFGIVKLRIAGGQRLPVDKP